LKIAFAVLRSFLGLRASASRACSMAATNGVNLIAIGPRRYFGAPTTGSLSHFATVLRDSPVSRAISRSDLFPRPCSRRILPTMSMVIIPVFLLHKNAAG